MYSPLKILTKRNSLWNYQYQLPITGYTDFKLKPNPEARPAQAIHSLHVIYDIADSL
jgi:hypothetical protein